MTRFRISAISYLNTAPLMWDFEHGSAGAAFDITYTLPSQCAAELEHGTADIGIIPSAAYATIPTLAILPGVCIASRNAVRSILLVSHKPLDAINTVALDSSSLTSVALTRVLFEKYWGGGRQFSSLPPDLDPMLATHDACLLIGDPALQVDRSQYRTLDLAAIFQESRDHGLMPATLAHITRTWAPKLGLSEEDVRQYLTTNIHYYLDEDCLDGLRLFYRYAYECGVLPRVPELHFADAKPALI